MPRPALWRAAFGAPLVLFGAARVVSAQATAKPTIAQYLSPQFPLGVPATARKAERVAWIGYDKGQRNVWTAVAPDFKPVRLTQFMEDDGTDMDEISISDDGSMIVFVRGTAPNRAGWNADPSHDPNGSERAIWAVRSIGGPAWRLAAGNAPALSPDGRYVLFVKDSQIYHVRLSPPPVTPVDKGDVPFIKEWGRQSDPQWSPDGSRIAFVSDRVDHAFIGIYNMKTKTVDYFAPSTDRDGSPTWSSDGKQIA
ncbi:MAG TPA: S9 family peptidase, partial [Gemmatimonadaceae bacterium]|nr:S9 family peptidase [Gemmatimonadaceae bacterium]